MTHIKQTFLTAALLMLPAMANHLRIIGTTTADEALGTITFSGTELQLNGNSYELSDIRKIIFAGGDVAIEQTEAVQNAKSVHFAPNPVPLANGEIFFTTPSTISGLWEVKIYDALGNRIDHQTFDSNGGYIYRWDLTNRAGTPVASGTYVAVITVTEADGTHTVIKRTIGVQQ